MKILKKISDCEQISVLNNQLFMVVKDKTYLEYMLIYDGKINVAWQGCTVDNQVYFSNGNTLYILSEKELQPFFEDGFYNYFRLIDNDKILCSGRINEFELKYTLMNLNKKDLWTEAGYIGIGLIDKNHIIVHDRLVRSPFEIRTIMNKKLWRFDLPNGFEIFGNIQVLDNILFFTACKNVNEAQNTYGIDIHSGQIKWELNYCIPYTIYVLASLINEKDNLCYGYGGDLYQVFDPINGEIVLTKNMSEYYKQGIDPKLSINTLNEDKLWFVSGRGEKSKFGALNILTNEIDFVQDYPLENDGQLGKPIYHENKLYLLDSENTLHIFEKE